MPSEEHLIELNQPKEWNKCWNKLAGGLFHPEANNDRVQRVQQVGPVSDCDESFSLFNGLMSFRTIRLWPEPQPLDSVMSDICKRSRQLSSSMHRRGMLCLCEGHEIRPPLPPAATGHRPPDQLEALEQKCLLLRRSSKGQITFQSGRLHL